MDVVLELVFDFGVLWFVLGGFRFATGLFALVFWLVVVLVGGYCLRWR